MISYFFRFVSVLVIMQVGGVGEHDAGRGADHASMQGWLATTYNSQGEFADTGEGRGHRGGLWTQGRAVDTGEGRGHRGGQETKWRVVAMKGRR